MDSKAAAATKALAEMALEANAKSSAAVFIAQAALRLAPDKAAAAIELDRLIASLQDGLPQSHREIATRIERHLRSARADLLGEVPGQESPSPWELLRKRPS